MQVAQQWQKHMGRRDGLLGQSQHIIQSMKQKKRCGAALATEAMTVQLGATSRKKKRPANRRLPVSFKFPGQMRRKGPFVAPRFAI